CTAATYIRTPWRWDRASIPSGSTRCASTRASCGDRTRIRRLRCASMHSSPISMPPELDAPVFKAPWEAQAFALVVHLQGRGAFTWNEWAATLGEEIKRAQAGGDPDRGDT